MSLRKLYLLWLIAAGISSGVGILFFLITMHMTYGNFSGHDDFDGLVYAIESLIVIIFSTGMFSALLVMSGNQKIDKQLKKQLAIRLFSFYSVFALFCIATFRFAFIYLNPLSIFIFAVLPQIAWKASVDNSKAKKWTLAFACLLAAILVLGGLEFLNIVLSDPYRK